MTCPNYKCPECTKVELNRVLSRVGISRETESYGTGIRDARDVPFVEAHNAAVLRDNREREQWRDTFQPDHATDLALQVGKLAGELSSPTELRRVGE